MIVYKKPSVNAKEYTWELISVGVPTWGYTGAMIELYRQDSGVPGLYIDHYRLKLGDKWVRKTFFGESAWNEVERYAQDKFGVAVTT